MIFSLFFFKLTSFEDECFHLFLFIKKYTNDGIEAKADKSGRWNKGYSSLKVSFLFVSVPRGELYDSGYAMVTNSWGLNYPEVIALVNTRVWYNKWLKFH